MRAEPEVKRRFVAMLEEINGGVFVSVQVEIPRTGRPVNLVSREHTPDLKSANRMVAKNVKHGSKNFPYLSADAHKPAGDDAMTKLMQAFTCARSENA